MYAPLALWTFPDRFLCAIVRNTVMLIGKCRLGPRHFHTDRPVFTKVIHWSINRNPKHVQLILKCLYYLCCVFHLSELWSKRWCINWVLPLVETYYCRPVEKQKYAGIRSSRLSVSSMICFKKTMRLHEVASCNWRISLDRLLVIPVKMCPVTLLEPVFFNGRICRFETQLPISMRLQISKNMECLIEVPYSGHHDVAR